MHEVQPVKDAVHKLDIAPDALFSKNVHQKPLTPLQRQYLYLSIDAMLEASIIKPCAPEDIKCVLPMTSMAVEIHTTRGF